MNHRLHSRRRRRGPLATLLAAGFLASSSHARASMFQGETLDSMANVIAWVVLLIAPVVGITVFWLVHILPEKIAHKKMHPQTGAIQCLCLLSLCFGGLLWPIAWLWAYTKPVLHKLAYGTDVDESLAAHGATKSLPAETTSDQGEVEKLRTRVLELEAKLNPKGGKA
jgi:CBS domain containing-hemolysin-like protein